MAAIRASPLGIARAITEPTHSVTTAIAGAGIRPRAVGAIPAQVTGARAVETRPMIRTIHGAQAIGRHPSGVTVIPVPSRVADARFVDASAVC